jgi:site-specific DNA recombinase
MGTRAAIYVRQSVDKETGIERQRRLCESLVEDRSWELVGVYEDNDTSATKRRGKKTSWARLLADAEAGQFEVVVAVNLDRLARSIRDVLALNDTGVSIMTIEGDLDTLTPDGKFRAHLLAILSEFEMGQKSVRQLRANLDKANRGIPYVTKRPFGYNDDGLTLNADEAQHVRWAYQHVIAGGSLWSIRKKWQAEGVTPAVPRNVLDLPHDERPSPKPWSNSGILGLLRRERNAGIVTYQGKRVEGVVGTWEAIVSVEDFELVQSILDSRGKSVPQSREPKWLLSGVAVCGTCNSKMTSTVMNGNGVYRCSTSMMPGRPAGKHPLMTASLLDPKVVGKLASVILATEGFGSTPPIDDDVRIVQQRLAEVRAQRAHLLDLEADDPRSGPDIKPKLRALNDREASLQEEFADIGRRKAESTLIATVRNRFWSNLVDHEVDWNEAVQAAKAIREEFEKLTLAEKRTLIRSTLSVVVWPTTAPKRVVIEELDSPSEYAAEYEPELA